MAEPELNMRITTGTLSGSTLARPEPDPLAGFIATVQGYKREETKTLVSKQRDYGPGNIANCPLGPVPGLIVRLYDKLARLAHLTKEGVDPEHEALRDTALDIANYGTILAMVLDGEWPTA